MKKKWIEALGTCFCPYGVCGTGVFDKISIAVLFSDPHFQSAMGIAEDKAKLGWLMTSFLLAYGFHQSF